MTTSVSIRLLPGLGEDMVPPRPAAPLGRSLKRSALSCQDPFALGEGALREVEGGGPSPALRLRGGLLLPLRRPLLSRAGSSGPRELHLLRLFPQLSFLTPFLCFLRPPAPEFLLQLQLLPRLF